MKTDESESAYQKAEKKTDGSGRDHSTLGIATDTFFGIGQHLLEIMRPDVSGGLAEGTPGLYTNIRRPRVLGNHILHRLLPEMFDDYSPQSISGEHGMAVMQSGAVRAYGRAPGV